MNRRTFFKAMGAGIVSTGILNSGPKKALATPQYNWKMVTPWPVKSMTALTGEYLAKAIESMSGNRIKIKVYHGGQLIPSHDCFDAVSEGKADIAHGVAYFWKKHEAFNFFATIPFGLNALETMSWITCGGGQELWDELYAAYNVKPFLAGSPGAQMGGWFNKEIQTIDDFKGVKMRIPGIGGKVLARAGGIPKYVAPEKIYAAMVSGELDAAEFIAPKDDMTLKLYKVAKYYYWPAWQEPGAIGESFINKTLYESLPADLQQVVRHASHSAFVFMLSNYMARNAQALLELVTEHNVKLMRFPSKVLFQLGKYTQEELHAIADRDPMSKKIFESYSSFRSTAVGWSQIGDEGFSFSRSQIFDYL